MSALPADRTPDMLGEAMSLADLGFRVIPIKPGGKHPPVPAWQDAATTDADVIRNWWTHLYRGHGIGIATGGGRIVLDIDVAGDKRGDDTLHELLERHGDLPDTVEAITGSGGRHIWLRVPCEVRNDAGRRLGHGIDVRGDGGQVLAPPTVHPNGTRYAWVAGHAPDEHAMAMAPAWLVDLLRDEPAPAPRAPATSTAPDDGPAARYNARTTWDQLLGDDGWTLHSERGEQRWVRPGKSRREGASATVGHDGRDVLKVFTSSVTWLPEGAYSRFGYYACRRHGGDRSAAARALRAEEQRMLPTQPQATIGAPTTTVAPSEAAAVERPTRSQQMRSRLYHLGTGEFGIPEATPLIDGVLNEGTLAVIYGPPKSAKSFLMLDQALHIACGMDWLGRATRAGHVLYVLGEGAGGAQRRAKAWLTHHGLASAPRFHLLADTVRLLDDLEIGCLLEIIDELPERPVAIYIDTLARAMVGGEENDASSMGKLVHAADRIRAHTGATVSFVHHAGKDATKGSRGSTALLGALDSEFSVSKEAGKVTMKNTAQRDLEPLDDQEFELVAAGASVVPVYKGVGRTSEAKAKEDSGRPVHIMAALSQFLGACGEMPVKQARLTDQMRCRKTTTLDALAYLEAEGYARKIVEPNAKGGAPSYMWQHVATFDGVLHVGFGTISSHQFPSVPISSGNRSDPPESISSRSPMATGTDARELMNGPDEGLAAGSSVPRLDGLIEVPELPSSSPSLAPTPSPQIVADHLADVIAEIG